MIDTTHLVTILLQGGEFIAAFAAIAASIVMANLTRKFGSGVLASGFKTNSWGIFFIAIAILIDSCSQYLISSGYLNLLPSYVNMCLLITKGAFFILGTYIIVIGSKRTGDHIEKLMK